MTVDVDALEQECRDEESIVPGDDVGMSVIPWWLGMQMLSALRQQQEDGEAMSREVRILQLGFQKSEADNARLREAAQDLYDNRLGWSDGRNPYAPPEFWERLRQALGDSHE